MWFGPTTSWRSAEAGSLQPASRILDELRRQRYGQMAIHLPLNTARIGAFSTHTAHPDVLDSMQAIVSTALAGTYRISNPYLSLTKAEVVERVWTAMRDGVPVTSSCWRNTWLPEGVTHCGECVPCMIRRVAIETHGDDPTPYGRDSFAQNFSTMDADDEARRNLAALCEFSRKFETMSDADLIDEWPELNSDRDLINWTTIF